MTRSNLYLGMITPFFEGISSDNVSNYVTIATFIVPAGCLFTPVVEKGECTHCLKLAFCPSVLLSPPLRF